MPGAHCASALKCNKEELGKLWHEVSKQSLVWGYSLTAISTSIKCMDKINAVIP